MSASSSDEEPSPKRKKGVVNDAYNNYKGELVPKKSVPETVSCKCPNKCYLKVNKGISNIWDYFYSLENKNTQDTHLQTLIEVTRLNAEEKIILSIPLASLMKVLLFLKIALNQTKYLKINTPMFTM